MNQILEMKCSLLFLFITIVGRAITKYGSRKGQDGSSTIFISNRETYVCHDVHEIRHCSSNGAISRYMANFGCKHWNIVKWVLRYFSGVADLSLYYGFVSLECVKYMNAHFAENRDRRKSTTSYIFSMSSGAIN
uniref:Uncharacterized protein n=1 Tax=Ananas comosus var. bracteatus TaxID=296719 RepID=A0A6V7NGQ8_ANACO|nr:unnamed protein product [Ananas comosus var. bracteatus]